MDVKVEPRTSEPLTIDVIEVGKVYQTNGGGGPEPDGAYYIVADNGGLISLNDGTYYPPQYAGEFRDWVFYEVVAKLVVTE